MRLTDDIQKYIDQSVLCWLATVNDEHMPNVSPKEIFKTYEGKIIIANIASPQTVKNIIHNENVCISFVDVLVQKGYQIRGKAKILYKVDTTFKAMAKELSDMMDNEFPFDTITEIEITHAKPIIAPRYLLYPDTTESQQIESAKKMYNL